MKLNVLALILTIAMPAAAADPVEEVRQAEIAFAKAFTDRNPDAFFALVANDATFLSGGGSQRGKQQVKERWSRFFEGPEAPFQWGPERVEVTADGKLGLSIGPIYDAKGNYGGSYQSVWAKQADGSWKVIFDGPGAPPPDLGDIEEGFITTEDGAKLHYKKLGQGPQTIIAPLDFVLGEQLRQFADGATVITYDMRNRGRSERVNDPSKFTIENDVRDLEAVRAHFKVEKFVPVGFSYLGAMVIRYALAYPDRVTRIVQVAPAPFRKDPADRNDPVSIPEPIRKKHDELKAAGAMEKSPREYCEAYNEVMAYYMVGDPKNAPKFDRSSCALETEWPVNVFPIFAGLMSSAEKTATTPERLQSVKVPVLTIHGTLDRNAPYRGGVEWAKTLPDARLVTVPGAAHAIWLDDPVALWGSIRHFLRREWPLGSERPK